MCTSRSGETRYAVSTNQSAHGPPICGCPAHFKSGAGLHELGAGFHSKALVSSGASGGSARCCFFFFFFLLCPWGLVYQSDLCPCIWWFGLALVFAGFMFAFPGLLFVVSGISSQRLVSSTHLVAPSMVWIGTVGISIPGSKKQKEVGNHPRNSRPPVHPANLGEAEYQGLELSSHVAPPAFFWDLAWCVYLLDALFLDSE